jgi:hypothetical protein
VQNTKAASGMGDRGQAPLAAVFSQLTTYPQHNTEVVATGRAKLPKNRVPELDSVSDDYHSALSRKRLCFRTLHSAVGDGPFSLEVADPTAIRKTFESKRRKN